MYSHLDKKHREAPRLHVQGSKGMPPKMLRSRSISRGLLLPLMLIVLNTVKPSRWLDQKRWFLELLLGETRRIIGNV